MKKNGFVGLLLLIWGGCVGASTVLTVGPKAASPGQAVEIPIILASNAEIVGLQFNIRYDAAQMEAFFPTPVGVTTRPIFALDISP